MRVIKKIGLRILLFLTVAILIITSFFLSDSNMGTYGINRTVGWAWEFAGILPLVFAITLLFSLLGYVIMYAIKARFSKKVLTLNITFLLGAIISVFSLRMTLSITFILTIALVLSAMLMLYTNIIIALVRAKDRK